MNTDYKSELKSRCYTASKHLLRTNSSNTCIWLERVGASSDYVTTLNGHGFGKSEDDRGIPLEAYHSLYFEVSPYGREENHDAVSGGN